MPDTTNHIYAYFKGNVIYNHDLDKVSFIDYEYSGYNFQAFDIADHFAEYAGTENIDYSLFPTKEYQLKWLRIYLEEYYDNKQIAVTDELVEKFYCEVNKYVLMSHLFWGMYWILKLIRSHNALHFYLLLKVLGRLYKLKIWKVNLTILYSDYAI